MSLYIVCVCVCLCTCLALTTVVQYHDSRPEDVYVSSGDKMLINQPMFLFVMCSGFCEAFFMIMKPVEVCDWSSVL